MSKHLSKSIVSGAVIGGILGAMAGLLDQMRVFTVPGLRVLLVASPVTVIVTATALGILLGGGIGALIGELFTATPARKHVLSDGEHEAKLQVREEQLEISKKWTQTGRISMHREVLQEKKNIIVPVTREELVIEKETFDTGTPHNSQGHTETIRIPITEEHITVIKHPVTLNDVSIHKRQFQESEHIDETVKKERVHLETTGNLDIVNNNVGKDEINSE